MSNPAEKFAKTVTLTIEVLAKKNIVPAFTTFDITEDMLRKYVEVYGTFGPQTGNKRFNYGYARKLAGLNLLQLKFSRGATARECKEGMVYLIANPAWPAYLKIGMTVDIDTRLRSYQTYDPLQRFYVQHYDFVLERRAAEKELLDKHNIHLVDGEWIKHHNAQKVINVVRQY